MEIYRGLVRGSGTMETHIEANMEDEMEPGVYRDIYLLLLAVCAVEPRQVKFFF